MVISVVGFYHSALAPVFAAMLTCHFVHVMLRRCLSCLMARHEGACTTCKNG